MLAAEDTQPVCIAPRGHSVFERWFAAYRDAEGDSARLLVHKVAHYFDIYERHLSRLRSAALRTRGNSIRLLELGVHSGGSLLMWRAYFGERAELHGVDINPHCANLGSTAGAHVHIGSTANVSWLSALAREHGPWDIIVDDASHQSLHMRAAFRTLYQHALSARGVYIDRSTRV